MKNYGKFCYLPVSARSCRVRARAPVRIHPDWPAQASPGMDNFAVTVQNARSVILCQGVTMSLRQRLNLDQDPVLLMDGSAYVFRSFYANQNMSRADGMPTNVLYMVLRMLFKILRDETPAHFGFILDGKGKNFRHRLYTDYKANRLATPEPLSAQIPPLMQAVRSLGLFTAVSDDCEADDCIASLAARFGKERPVVIIGADKDLKQCLSPNVYIWDPSGKEERLTSLQSFEEEQGFPPSRWPDYQAVVGDSSDNIPGVPGIGAKGAGTLFREFSGLEDIRERLAAVPPALRKKLEGNLDQAFLSRSLTILKLDCCADITLDQLAPKAPAQQELMDFMNEYELRSLSRELSSMLRINAAASQASGKTASKDGREPLTAGFESRDKNTTAAAEKKAPAKKADADEKNKTRSAPLFEWAAQTGAGFEQGSLLGGSAWQDPLNNANAQKAPLLSSAADLPDAETYALITVSDAGGDKNDHSLLIGDGKAEFTLPHGTPPPQGLADKLLQAEITAAGLKDILQDYPELRPARLDACFDLSIAAWLLSPEEYDYSFKGLARRWGAEASALAPEAANSATALALNMQKLMRERLKGNQLEELMRDIEMPLIPVLLGMQEAGLGMDRAAFKKFLDETETELSKLTGAIYAAAGREFNIRSAKQLGELLFDELKLPKARKTGGGQASTAQETLEKLQGKHPIIEPLLEYRKLEKLRSTYLEPLPRLADKNDRLHTSFNQSATATGRLSSSNPNLQNIPVRGPLGSRMRACFTAAPGKLLVSADYSQIELRVLAHLSQDSTLLDAFRKNEDIHRRTAALLFDVSQDQVTPDQRRDAKTINFGLVYGMGPQKLARELGIGMNEAKAFIDRYFERLVKLREYFDAVEQEAREKGFVATMTGRRRPCPDILSANQQLRSRARRQAINTCIQGSAADIIKLAMLATARDEELKSLNAVLVLQIHDELLLECPEGNAEKAGERLAAIMSQVKPGGQEMSVPLSSDWGAGKSWSDAH